MILIKWQGLDQPTPEIPDSFRKRLEAFVFEKVHPLLTEIEKENGYFDITDANNPSQLAITPKNFSPELTKKILRRFSEWSTHKKSPCNEAFI